MRARALLGREGDRDPRGADGPPPRPGRWRRRLLALAGVGLLAFSMTSVVRRDAEARRLSRELEVLERAEQATRDRLAEEQGRVDSLASRARIREAAAELGLRPSRDSEIVFLREAARPTGPGASGG